MSTASIRKRTLYTVRVHADFTSSGRPVGYKGRLLPRKAAVRVVQRLRRAGLDVACWPLAVNTTPVQRAYLDARYGA